MVNNWLNIIQDSLFPPTCILCEGKGHHSQDICLPCFNDLEKNISCCYRCGQTFENSIKTPNLCGRCINTPPLFDEAHIPFIHHDAMRYLIASLKFSKQYKNARLLGGLLANYLETSIEKPQLIIPMPLHKKRMRKRGFNQAIEIAKTVSKQLYIPLDTKSCIRHKNTPHQVSLSAEQRQENIEDAFIVATPIKADHVAILDDVITTGSTANELAKVLKQSGVSRVDLWGCARA